VGHRGKVRKLLPLPSDTDPESDKCIRVYIPDEPTFLTNFWGQMYAMSRWYAYRRDDNETGKAAAARFEASYMASRIDYMAGTGCGISEDPPGEFQNNVYDFFNSRESWIATNAPYFENFPDNWSGSGWHCGTKYMPVTETYRRGLYIHRQWNTPRYIKGIRLTLIGSCPTPINDLAWIRWRFGLHDSNDYSWEDVVVGDDSKRPLVQVKALVSATSLQIQAFIGEDASQELLEQNDIVVQDCRVWAYGPANMEW